MVLNSVSFLFPNSCPLSWWCHPIVSSSVVPFLSCLQSFTASGSFPVSHFFPSGGQSIGASASASVLSKNIQDWRAVGGGRAINIMWPCFSFFQWEIHDPQEKTDKILFLPWELSLGSEAQREEMLGKHSNCYFNSFTSILLLFNQSKLLQNPSPTHPFPFLSHSPFPPPYLLPKKEIGFLQRTIPIFFSFYIYLFDCARS